MLTKSRPIQPKGIDPALKPLVEKIKNLPRADFDELIDLIQHLRQSDEPEECESLVRAIEEILVQRPVAVRNFPLTDSAMTPGLKRWAEQIGRRIRELRQGAG